MDNYWATCLEPVHVGTGEYKLGRVDNTIVREPATGIPKIPATSIAGIFRAFSGIEKESEVERVFGSSERPSKLQFTDGRVIFFPIRSSMGTVWITTEERLNYSGASLDEEAICKKDRAYLVKTDGSNHSAKKVALGWMYFSVNNSTSIVQSQDVFTVLPGNATVFVLSDKLYYHLVNDNLEVRTSVKINVETGVAETGGLFTSESLPRGTVLFFSINRVVSISREEFDGIIESVNAHLQLTGMGGMRTRGFGRLELQPSEVK